MINWSISRPAMSQMWGLENVEFDTIAVVQPSFSPAVNRKQKSKKVNIAFFLISGYLPFPTVVYDYQLKKRMAEHRSFRNDVWRIFKLQSCERIYRSVEVLFLAIHNKTHMKIVETVSLNQNTCLFLVQKTGNVRIGNRKVSELERVGIGKCQNWKV